MDYLSSLKEGAVLGRKALILGVTGQDGSYLSEFLLGKDYDVLGMTRRTSSPECHRHRLNHIEGKIEFIYGDVLDFRSLVQAFGKYQPDEIYNLAGQSHVRISFDMPIHTAEVNGIGALNVLEAARLVCPQARIYQASSSEMFGNSVDADGYQRESTPMIPVSPYGCSKLFAHSAFRNYRKAYGMFCSSGILFNHESKRRSIQFVTGKVVKGAVEIKLGLREKLELGALDSSRDWGHAADYVRAMHLILNHNEPDDFVVSTGVSHSVMDLCEYSFGALGLDYRDYVVHENRELRPEELVFLKGDSGKARKILNWKPLVSFESMLDEMIDFWSSRLANKK